jgi:hypothetical protein
MTTAQQAAYESAATMRRAWAMVQIEMNEFRVAATAPKDEAAMERARQAVHAYIDAHLDALSAAMSIEK